MIQWNPIRASRPAKSVCRAWLEQNITDGKFWRTLSKLGFKQQSHEVYKYLIRYRHKDLAKNMKKALKRCAKSA